MTAIEFQPRNVSLSSNGALPLLLLTLTSREREVMELVLNGESNRDIGAALSISERTVEVHLTKIYRKLRVSNRNQLVRKLLG